MYLRSRSSLRTWSQRYAPDPSWADQASRLVLDVHDSSVQAQSSGGQRSKLVLLAPQRPSTRRERLVGVLVMPNARR